jgi:hypothetical protein
MARGWESKSVESQIESASENSNSAGHQQLSDSDRKRNREREQLLLSRTYVQRQLETTKNDRYGGLLRNELAEIERKLAQLESRNSRE